VWRSLLRRWILELSAEGRISSSRILEQDFLEQDFLEQDFLEQGAGFP
jgi:hypothetical protein